MTVSEWDHQLAHSLVIREKPHSKHRDDSMMEHVPSGAVGRVPPEIWDQILSEFCLHCDKANDPKDEALVRIPSRRSKGLIWKQNDDDYTV